MQKNLIAYVGQRIELDVYQSLTGEDTESGSWEVEWGVNEVYREEYNKIIKSLVTSLTRGGYRTTVLTGGKQVRGATEIFEKYRDEDKLDGEKIEVYTAGVEDLYREVLGLAEELKERKLGNVKGEEGRLVAIENLRYLLDGLDEGLGKEVEVAVQGIIKDGKEYGIRIIVFGVGFNKEMNGSERVSVREDTKYKDSKGYYLKRDSNVEYIK